MHISVFRVTKRNSSKRRIGVQAACGNCRSRKLACDGCRPRCSRCVKRAEEKCTYETERADETRMQAMKREMDKMKMQLEQVAQTLEALRDLPPNGAARLVIDVLGDPNPTASLIDVGLKIQMQSSNLSRQISMLDSMRATFPNTTSCIQFELYLYFPKWYPPLTADEVQLPGADAYLVDLFERQAARTRQLSLPSGSSLATHTRDEQLEGFQIAHWNVWVPKSCLNFWIRLPISVGLAGRAMNAYLRTDHVLFGFMDAELFLRDLIHREDRYCSTALVNAVLHYGCTKIASLNEEAAFAVTHLEGEVERILEEDFDIRIAKIAALNVHYVALVFAGPFEQAVAFLEEAVDLCDVLYGWTEASSQYQEWCHSEDDEKAMSHVVWGVFGSVAFRALRWRDQVPPPIPRLPIPYLDLSTRSIVALPSSPAANVEKISCERYIFAASTANGPFVRETVMLQLSESLTDEERAIQTSSIYRRALDAGSQIERPPSWNPGVLEAAAIVRMWSHVWILSLFQPLTSYRGAIPGFQASAGTAGAIFAASARQLQHYIFFYQRYHLLAPPTATLHAPIVLAATGVVQIRQVVDRARKFQALLSYFADLAITFPGLRQLMQSLALTGFGHGLLDLHFLRSLFCRCSDMCRNDRTGGFRAKSISAVDPRTTYEIAAVLRERSYDTHFATLHGTDVHEVEDEPLEDG